MANEQGGKESSDRDWRSQNFRDGMTNQIQQAVAHCVTPQANNAQDLETRAYSRSSSQAEYIDIVGQVIIRLNVVGNGNRAIGEPNEAAVHEVYDDEGNPVIPNVQRSNSMQRVDQHGVNSLEATLVHKVGVGPDQPNMSIASNLNAAEEKPGETEASGEGTDDGKEMEINRKKGRMEQGVGDVVGYLRRLIREDKEKQIQDNKDCFKGDVENADFEEKKRAIDKFIDKCSAKVNKIRPCQQSDEETPSGLPTESNLIPVWLPNFRYIPTILKDTAIEAYASLLVSEAVQPPSYLCDQWSHKIYKDPVVTPSGFTYERGGIEDHLKNVGDFDPITHVKLTADLLLPNYAMKKLVDAYMANKPYSPM